MSHPAELRTVAVVGVGLIGGSLARDLAARGVRVLARDRDEAAVREAAGQGIVHPWTGEEAVDAVVLAAPVRAAPDLLRELLPRLDGVRLVTDVGSTKRSIVEAAEALGIGERFVGSHPLAGDHRSGWDASRAGLFDGARVFLTPTPSTSPDAMRLAEALWTMAGGRPEVIGADEHDARLAWTSHLPQAVSSALAAGLARAGIARGELGPGGRDVTRLAGSSPGMWADIATDNADALAPALAAVENELRELRTMLDSADAAPVRAFFARGREWHGG